MIFATASENVSSAAPPAAPAGAGLGGAGAWDVVAGPGHGMGRGRQPSWRWGGGVSDAWALPQLTAGPATPSMGGRVPTVRQQCANSVPRRAKKHVTPPSVASEKLQYAPPPPLAQGTARGPECAVHRECVSLNGAGLAGRQPSSAAGGWGCGAGHRSAGPWGQLLEVAGSAGSAGGRSSASGAASPGRPDVTVRAVAAASIPAGPWPGSLGTCLRCADPRAHTCCWRCVSMGGGSNPPKYKS